MPENHVTNIVVAGLGGQGVILASDVIADAAFRAGLDVKKSEIHGMSQRGGSVTSDVRFGTRVLSPMVPAAAADFLVVLALDQLENNRHRLRPDGVLIGPEDLGESGPGPRRSLNIALVGVLSGYLPQIGPEVWVSALKAHLPEKLHGLNVQAFENGRAAAAARRAGVLPARLHDAPSPGAP